MDPLQPKIAGYEIIGRLGAGGMGIVWEAVQLSTRRHVALKLLSEASLGSERRKTRFVREVQLAASLEHPNIARVYDSGLDKGVYYYAMELVKGPPLDEFVKQLKLKPKQILILMRRVCQAMAYAHGRGVIHRDLKPSNILVDRNGQPHVLDFGLAKLLDSDGAMSVSIDGDVTGTPMYMSPEQAAGDPGKIDARTDVYALGIIAYRLLTGTSPHDLSGTYLQVIRRLAEEEVRPPNFAGVKVAGEVEAILLKALARDPAERYATAGELGDDIIRYLAGEPITARPAGFMQTATRQLSKHRWPAIVMALVVALVVTSVALLISIRRHPGAVALNNQVAAPPAAVQPIIAVTRPFDATAAMAEPQAVQRALTQPAAGVSAPLPAPAGLTATAGNGQVQLTWNAMNDAPGTCYYVSSGTASGGPYYLAASTNGTSYTATGLAAGSRYYFVVNAYNRAGISAKSAEVSAVPAAPPPSPPPPPPPPPAPTGVSAAAGDGQVTLNWSAVDGAASYTVSYGQMNGSANHVATVPSGTTYTATGLTNGTDYYFIVAAVNAGGSTPHMPVAEATPRAAEVDLNRGLVLHFSFAKRDVGGMVRDESGNGNDGKVQGATWVGDAGGRGAYHFNGVDRLTDAIVVQDNPSLHLEQITESAWIRTRTADQWWRRIIDKNWLTGFDLTMGGNYKGKSWRGKTGMEVIGKYEIYGDQSIADGNWHHVAATYDGAIQTLYVDGRRQKETRKWAGAIDDDNAVFRIGNGIPDPAGRQPDGAPEVLAFNGDIGPVRIYNRALSPDEIVALRDAESRSADASATPAAAQPVAPAQPLHRREPIANSLGMKLAYIPPGSFLMGSPADEPGRSDNETQHKVTLTHGFYMGTTHVTVGQFAAFIANTRYRTEVETNGRAWTWDDKWTYVPGLTWRNAGFSQGNDDPVVNVSWNDAMAFCQWLSRKEANHYRLPTEAEWEYACRAGTTTAVNQDNGTVTSGDTYWSPGHSGGHTHPVGQKGPNSWGLFDMYGNAWEWCSEWAGSYPDFGLVDPTGPSVAPQSGRRVIRGGCWTNNPASPNHFRSAWRWDFVARTGGNFIGFRVVLDAEN